MRGLQIRNRTVLICDGHDTPLAIKLTRANIHDSTQALPLLDGIPSLQGRRGRPRCRPDSLLGDRAYDAEYIRYALRAQARQDLTVLVMPHSFLAFARGWNKWRDRDGKPMTCVLAQRSSGGKFEGGIPGC